MSTIALRILLLGSFTMLFAACTSGGELTLESGARLTAPSQGSPFVRINQGGQALLVQQGMTPTTGVHGYVTLQTVSSSTLTSSSGNTLIINAQPGGAQ